MTIHNPNSVIVKGIPFKVILRGFTIMTVLACLKPNVADNTGHSKLDVKVVIGGANLKIGIESFD